MSESLELAQTLHDWSELFLRHAMSEFKKIMDDYGISPSQMIALFRLYRSGPCNISAIGTQLGVTNAASSQLIDRLVVLGLVDRKEDPVDRRVKHLSITVYGRALIEQAIAARRVWLEKLTTELTPEQQAIVITALSLLTERAALIVS